MMAGSSMYVLRGKWYLISKCFSEYDIPNNVGYNKKAILEAIKAAGHRLYCGGVSNTGVSGWFAIPGCGGLPIHKKFLTLALDQPPAPLRKKPYEVIVTVDVPVYVYEYTPDGAAEAAARQASMDRKYRQVLGTAGVKEMNS